MLGRRRLLFVLGWLLAAGRDRLAGQNPRRGERDRPSGLFHRIRRGASLGDERRPAVGFCPSFRSVGRERAATNPVYHVYKLGLLESPGQTIPSF